MSDGPKYRPVYKALHRPLTLWGVDRRLFFFALLLGAATFNMPRSSGLSQPWQYETGGNKRHADFLNSCQISVFVSARPSSLWIV